MSRSSLTSTSIVLAILIMVCGISGFAERTARQASGDERFRVSIYLVTVEAIVTGKKGRPVLTLKPEDFRIFEDEAEQSLEFFQVDPRGEHDPVSVPLTHGDPPANGSAVSENSNLLVILLDYSTTTLANQKMVRDGARKYAAAELDGRDWVGVFAFDSSLHVLQSPTRDPVKVAAAFSFAGSRGDAVGGERESLTAGVSRSVERQEALSNQIGNLIGIAGRGAVTTGVTAAIALAQAELDMARQTELRYYSLKSSFDDQISRSILLAIQAITGALAHIPGRKSLVLISEGFTVHPNARRILESTLASSVRSNTAIYTLDARGLMSERPVFETTELESVSALQRGTRTRVVNGESQFDRAAMIGSDQEESLLRYLANATGGIYQRNSNDISRGLGRIDEDLHARYSLAYTTTNRKMDGAFRNIRVEVRPKGLKVRARKGYYAIP